MASGVRFFILFCFLLHFDGCQGWSWIVGEGRNSSIPPSCRSYCINVSDNRIQENNTVYLHPCQGTIYGNEKWDYNIPELPLSLSVKSNNGGGLLCIDLPVVVLDQLVTTYNVVLSPCNSSKRSQQWTFQDEYRLRNGLDAGTSNSDADGLYLHGGLGLTPMYVGNLLTPSEGVITEFTVVHNSTIDTYVPSLPESNSSNFIKNSYLQELNQVLDLGFRTTYPELRFYVCNWAVQGPLSYENGSFYENSSCPIPSCEGTTIIDLNSIKPNTIVPIQGIISQIVPTYPGIGYHLMLEVGRRSTCTSLTNFTVIIFNSNLPSSGKEFIMPQIERTTWETFHLDFTANSNKVNVTVLSQTNDINCGPLISSVKMYQYNALSNTTNSNCQDKANLANTTCDCSQNKANKVQLLAIFGWVVAAITTTVNTIAFFFICRLRKRSTHGSEDNDETWVNKVNAVRYSFKQMQSFTNNFSVLLGKGASASVFQGMLPDGMMIAVKRHNSSSGHEQTATTCEELNGLGEVSILSRVHHRYVLQFLGYCIERGERMLVSEHMPKGSLYDLLHGKGEKAMITWLQRMRIAYQVACGLEYLHHGANPPIVHRDMKSANILLTQDLFAKVADFGISKLGKLGDTRFHTTVTDLKGSLGYIDPEYFQTSAISEKSDVFGFGVLLLELITRRKAISMNSTPLYIWALKLYRRDGLLNILDPDLRDSVNTLEVEAMIEIVEACVNLEGQKRPSMAEVVKLFQSNVLLENNLHNCDEIMEMRTTNE